MSFRILVTAAGGTLAPLNIRLLRESRRHAVWVLAVDARVDAIGRHFADAFAQVPEGSDPRYAEVIAALVKTHGIDFVLPWSDEEALALATQRERIESQSAILGCAPLATLQIMSDKVATHDLLESVGIPMPAWTKVQTVSALREAMSQFMARFGEFAVKPTVARGNRGTVVIRKDIQGAQPYMGSREMHMDVDTFRNDYLADMQCPAIVMERLLPPAYDIDVLAHSGKLLRAMPRRRLNPAGIPFTGGVLVPTAPLLDLAQRITQALSLSWLYDYDLMTNAAGVPVPIELNPRPSGSIAAAILGGVPFYDDLISLAKGEALSEVALPMNVAVVPYMDCRVIPAGQI